MFSHALQTIKNNVELTTPSLSNFNANSIRLFMVLGCATTASARWVCFKFNNIPYDFSCQPFWNKYDLQGNILNILNETMDIHFVNNEACNIYYDHSKYFGSSGYGWPLCELTFPSMQTPDIAIIQIIQNNTPTHQFGTVGDIRATILFAVTGAASLTALGVFAANALKRNKNEENEYQVIDDNTPLYRESVRPN